MAWLIVIGVLILAIGPIFYLLPSKKDKRLAALRALARGAGLNVEISFLPKLDPSAEERVSSGGTAREAKTQCAAYQLAVGKRLDLTSFVLQRIPASPTVPVQEVFEGWGVVDPQVFVAMRGETQLLEHLRRAVGCLPHDTLALGCDNRFVSCYWLERADPASDAVERIKAELEHLKADLVGTYGPSTH